jgi:sensor domain CHASE-containing protein
MAELTFIAYLLSLISIVCNLWLWNAINEMKQERKREQVKRRLQQVVRPVQTPSKSKSPWGY